MVIRREPQPPKRAASGVWPCSWCQRVWDPDSIEATGPAFALVANVSNALAYGGAIAKSRRSGKLEKRRRPSAARGNWLAKLNYRYSSEWNANRETRGVDGPAGAGRVAVGNVNG